MAKKKDGVTRTLWAVHYKMQNHQEGWLVAYSKNAGEAVARIAQDLASEADYLSLKVELTAYKCGKWL